MFGYDVQTSTLYQTMVCVLPSMFEPAEFT